jgi:predicted TIM-barrel fold metal-dependent hydrolase
MGLARGIFMVDTHVFAQMGDASYLGQGEAWDNSSMLLYHMEKYGVDMCVIKNTVGRRNEINADIAKRYPDKIIALCNDGETQRKSQKGEAPWTIQAAVKELDELLSTGQYKGIGDGITRDRTPGRKILSWDERLEQICQIMELARKYKCPIMYHTGIPVGWAGQIDMSRSRAHAEASDNGNPLLCHEVASLYPDVPILLVHGGVEASAYYMDDYEKCLNVAASHKNVSIECGQWWAELYDKPLLDPNIGAKKLVWSCAWGQNNQQQAWMPGCVPETVPVTHMSTFRSPSSRTGGGAVAGGLQVDIWGWSLRELGKLNIPQDDLNLILGGNAAWLFGAKLPFPYERLFKKVDRGFEYTCMKTILE